eukprot:Lankesteria_metandrocarpae@DN5181_c2_g1_i4.p1
MLLVRAVYHLHRTFNMPSPQYAVQYQIAVLLLQGSSERHCCSRARTEERSHSAIRHFALQMCAAVTERCTALWCTALLCGARRCSVVHSTALWCAALLCGAQHCSVVRGAALWCTAL